MNLAEWLIQTRKRVQGGITQTELAQLSGVNQRLISTIETGHVKNPGLLSMAGIFRVAGEVFLPPNSIIKLNLPDIGEAK
jgi:predicted transcriptional regulator